MFNQALSVRRAGIVQFHATANQKCPVKAALKCSTRSYQIHPDPNFFENHTLLHESQKYSLRAGLRGRNQWTSEELPTSARRTSGSWAHPFTAHHLTDSISLRILSLILWRSLEFLVKRTCFYTLTCLQIKMVAPMNSSGPVVLQ